MVASIFPASDQTGNDFRPSDPSREVDGVLFFRYVSSRLDSKVAHYLCAFPEIIQKFTWLQAAQAFLIGVRSGLQISYSHSDVQERIKRQNA